MQAPRRPPDNEPSNPSVIRSDHLAAPGFSEHRIYWEEYGSLAGEPVIVMHGGPGAGPATAHPPAVSIRSDTASCFSTSAVAARARPVRAMMTQHYDPAPYRQQRRFPFPMRGWKTVSSAAHRARA